MTRMVIATDPVAAERAEVDLGAFDFWPDAASRIEGLGGQDAPPDPGYVFHTPYWPCPAGPILFRVAIAGLEANGGVLTLQVNELGDRPESAAQVTEVKPVRLRALARRGTASVAVKAQPGHSYALFGRLSDGTEARATDLTVAMVQGREPEGARGVAPTAAFQAVGAAPLLSSVAKPTLRRPASQLSTTSQRDEDEWGRLGEGRHEWPQVYALRCLEVAEVLRPEASILLLGEMAATLAPPIRARGCDVTTAPDLASGTADTLASGYDAVAWLNPAADPGSIGLPGSEDPLTDAEIALGAVHPGGLGVFVWNYSVDRQPGAVTRADLERMAIVLLSHHHDVAQLKFRGDPPAGSARRLWRRAAGATNASPDWFGLLVRRGPD